MTTPKLTRAIEAMTWAASVQGTANNATCLTESIAEIRALLAQSAALEKDAERYRWLRMQYWSDSMLFVVEGGKERIKLGAYCPTQELLDAATDDAIEASKNYP